MQVNEKFKSFCIRSLSLFLSLSNAQPHFLNWKIYTYIPVYDILRCRALPRTLKPLNSGIKALATHSVALVCNRLCRHWDALKHQSARVVGNPMRGRENKFAFAFAFEWFFTNRTANAAALCFNFSRTVIIVIGVVGFGYSLSCCSEIKCNVFIFIITLRVAAF